LVKEIIEMAEKKVKKPQSVPLDFTEEQIKRAREGKSKQVFEEALGQAEHMKIRKTAKEKRTKKHRSP
jgi:hypothetical protein